MPKRNYLHAPFARDVRIARVTDRIAFAVTAFMAFGAGAYIGAVLSEWRW